MLFRNPRAFAFVLIAIGTGLLAWYGPQWQRLPEWSDAEIEQSVELNLQLDLQRMGPHLTPSDEKLERLRDVIRAEVLGEIRREREELERWLGLGLLLGVLGLGQLVFSLAKRDP